MVAGLRLGKTRHHLVVHDRDPGKLHDLKKRYAVVVEPDLTRAVKQADVLIVAVRPSSVRELLQMVGKAIGKVNRALPGRQTLAVSVAAGVPLRVLSKSIGPPVLWARAMPSPVCRSGRGLTAVTFPRTLPRADRDRVRDFFGSFGQVVEIPENKFDAFTVTYSCSHGYHALATLARAAQEAGLDRKMALLASAHVLGGWDHRLARGRTFTGVVARGGGHSWRHCGGDSDRNGCCRIRARSTARPCCRTATCPCERGEMTLSGITIRQRIRLTAPTGMCWGHP